MRFDLLSEDKLKHKKKRPLPNSYSPRAVTKSARSRTSVDVSMGISPELKQSPQPKQKNSCLKIPRFSGSKPLLTCDRLVDSVHELLMATGGTVVMGSIQVAAFNGGDLQREVFVGISMV
eukprot:TRINITY_DN482_c0_g1_i1.p1 TRINITY_DN482_c0_g1~~TRINITY_DN482_c0_g1_i1.p1  ORF type:complete len:120 (-),score=16.30 TRINITY_DN482_c0_g1_i1:89-448(-)